MRQGRFGTGPVGHVHEAIARQAEASRHFRHHGADDFVAGRRIRRHVGAERGVVAHGELQVFHRVNRGGGDAGIEEVDLAEKFSLRDRAEQHLALLRESADVRHAIADDVQIHDGIAFLKNFLLVLRVPQSEERRDFGEFGFGEIPHDRDGSEEFDVHDSGRLLGATNLGKTRSEFRCEMTR